MGELMAPQEEVEMTHVYVWGNNSKRATLKGRECRIVTKSVRFRRSVLVEFVNSQREVVSFRALRRIHV